MYLPWNEGLAPGAFRSGSLPQMPFPLNTAHAAFFARARLALAQAITVLDIRAGERVLAPAYLCGAAIAPFQWAGVTVRPYPISPRTLRPDWPAIERLLAETPARALLLVHYFGLPSEPVAARAFCDRHGILLIEDCAHSFLSAAHGRPLGSFGDAAVFSLRKTLPIPNGAVLYLRDFSLPETLRQPPCRSTPLVLAPAVARHLAQRIGWRPRRFWRQESLLPPTREEPSPPEDPEGINAWALRLLPRLDMERVRTRRQENYRRFAAAIRSHPALRLIEANLPEDACPQVLPVLAPNAVVLSGALRRRGVHAYTWPALPLELEQASATAAWLAQHLLALPVHQGLNAAQIDYAAACLWRECDPKGKRLKWPL